jgi:hypothetical protein
LFRHDVNDLAEEAGKKRSTRGFGEVEVGTHFGKHEARIKEFEVVAAGLVGDWDELFLWSPFFFRALRFSVEVAKVELTIAGVAVEVVKVEMSVDKSAGEIAGSGGTVETAGAGFCFGWESTDGNVVLDGGV